MVGTQHFADAALGQGGNLGWLSRAGLRLGSGRLRRRAPGLCLGDDIAPGVGLGAGARRRLRPDSRRDEQRTQQGPTQPRPASEPGMCDAGGTGPPVCTGGRAVPAPRHGRVCHWSVLLGSNADLKRNPPVGAKPWVPSSVYPPGGQRPPPPWILAGAPCSAIRGLISDSPVVGLATD